MTRVNAGCGTTPVPGWANYDSSLSVWLAHHGLLAWLFRALGLLSEGSRHLLAVAKARGIVWANVAKRIPLPSSSAEVIYSSHMVAYLSYDEAKRFLAEARRVLAPDGVIRLVEPDFRRLVDRYLADGDVNAFLDQSRLTRRRRRSARDRLKDLFIGDRRRRVWMYDGPSLARLLAEMGFKDASTVPAGSTRIPDPGDLNLREREDESVYVEAVKP